MRNIRRGAAAVLALALAFLLAPAGRAAFRADYSDVPEDHWAYGSICRAAELELMQGVGGGRFGLGEDVTRASYAAMLCRLLGWELLAPETGSFSDNQDPDAWYYGAVETANAHGVFALPGRECRPDEAITREEMASMTVRALGYATLAGTVQGECPFSDVTTNRGYVTLANRMGLVNGVGGGQYAPRLTAAREQAAVVLLRAYDRLHGEVILLSAPPEDGVRVPSVEGTTGAVPLSPRAPLEGVAAAAAEAGEGGSLILCAVPCAQTVRDGTIGAAKPLTQAEFARYFSDRGAQTYRSARYESSYLLLRERDGSATVVWYESEDDLDGKIDLCRLLGIAAVYIERG